MEHIFVAALVNDIVKKVDRQWDSIDVGGGNEEVEFSDQRRIFALGPRIIGVIHFIERLEQFVVHTLAVEQRFLRPLEFETPHAVHRIFVIEKFAEIAFSQPKLLQTRHLLITRQCFGQKHAIDSTRRRPRNHVYHKTRSNWVYLGDRFLKQLVLPLLLVTNL